MKEYHIASNGKQSGPFLEEDVKKMLEQGQIQKTDMCWTEGMSEWALIASVFTPVLDVPPPIHLQNLTTAPLEQTTDYQKMRAEYIKHEASVKSVGVLYLLGGAALAISGIGSLFAEKNNPALGIGIALALALLAALQFWTGLRLRKLDKKARISTGLLSGIGLLGFPIGTIINGFILYLIFSKKGTVVFSDEYKEAILATPEIKYKTSKVVWIFVGLLLLILILIAVAALFSKK